MHSRLGGQLDLPECRTARRAHAPGYETPAPLHVQLQPVQSRGVDAKTGRQSALMTLPLPHYPGGHRWQLQAPSQDGQGAQTGQTPCQEHLLRDACTLAPACATRQLWLLPSAQSLSHGASAAGTRPVQKGVVHLSRGPTPQSIASIPSPHRLRIHHHLSASSATARHCCLMRTSGAEQVQSAGWQACGQSRLCLCRVTRDLIRDEGLPT
jgi:hypothetical protein